MARGSKKGACSAHIQKAKGNCLEHARRDYGEKNQPKYIMRERTKDNTTVYEHEAIQGRKSILPLVRQAERLYTEKTGQKCQKSFAPFREDVLSLPGRGDITNEQLMKFKAKVEAEIGWECYGIWYHRDEGYVKSKHIEGEEGEAINYHVHVLWYCQDPETGKAKRNDRQFFRLRQDWLADATGMERGNPAAETGIKGRTAMEQRIFAQEQRIDQLQRKFKAMEADYRAQIAKLQEEKRKAVEEARKQATASVWHKVKDAFGADGTINDLKAQIKAVKAQRDADREKYQAEVKKARQRAENASERASAATRAEIAKAAGLYQNRVDHKCGMEELKDEIKALARREHSYYLENKHLTEENKSLKRKLNTDQEQSRGIKFHP